MRLFLQILAIVAIMWCVLGTAHEGVKAIVVMVCLIYIGNSRWSEGRESA